MAVGIICEYNPFHYGHLYQLKKACAQTGQDAVCVMSGHFVQRGEPAVASKWTRTRMALSQGAGLVLELPTWYACSGAADFAFGACSILSHIPFVTSLSFGMEDPAELDVLQQAAGFLSPETDSYKTRLHKYLAQKMTFAQARQKALEDLCGHSLVCTRNSILALEYLCAMKKLDWHPVLVPVSRNRELISASRIREGLLRKEDISSSLPPECRELLRQDQPFLTMQDCFPVLKYLLSASSTEDLEQIHEMTPDLARRMMSAAKDALSYEDLVEKIKTSYYTTSRIRRVLLHVFLGQRTSRLRQLQLHKTAPYIRVLGVRKEKLSLLSDLCRTATLPVVTNLPSRLDGPAEMTLEDELHFSALCRSQLSRPSLLKASELSEPLVIL